MSLTWDNVLCSEAEEGLGHGKRSLRTVLTLPGVDHQVKEPERRMH
jgi:hypothetical protein